MKLINQVIRLSEADSGLSQSIVRCYNGYIDSKKLDKSKYFRRQAVIIENKHNGLKILRYVMGSAGMPINRSTIGLDYDGIDMLGVKFKVPVILNVRKASLLDTYIWFWKHPDLIVRTGIRLAVFGIGLSIIGSTFSIISLI